MLTLTLVPGASGTATRCGVCNMSEVCWMCDVRMGAWCFWCIFLLCAWCVRPYKVSDNVYVQKAEKKIVFANFYFWQISCQLLFFGRILPKTLFTAKNNEPSMTATSSRVPTAKNGFGCQKSLALSLPRKKFGTIPTKNKNRCA